MSKKRKGETEDEEAISQKPKRTRWEVIGYLIAKNGCVGSVCDLLRKSHPQHGEKGVRKKVSEIKKELIASGELKVTPKYPPFAAPNSYQKDDPDSESGSENEETKLGHLDKEIVTAVKDLEEKHNSHIHLQRGNRIFHHEISSLDCWEVILPTKIATIWPIPRQASVNDNDEDITFRIAKDRVTVNVKWKTPPAEDCQKFKEVINMEEVPKFERSLVITGKF